MRARRIASVKPGFPPREQIVGDGQVVDATYRTYCRRCGDEILSWQSHSYAIGPRAGHYCFGCEPDGVQITTIEGKI